MKKKTLLTFVVAVASMLPILSACGARCDGNVTKRQLLQPGVIKLTIHNGVGDDFCFVNKPEAEVKDCQVGDLYPNCAA